jgi:prepilin-type N-terminal cleavage/methylation domain-containing protein
VNVKVTRVEWLVTGKRASGSRHLSRVTRHAETAFTLMEIMVVVAIIGIILAAGVPSMKRLWEKEGFRKTMSDLIDVSNAARAEAIMHDAPAEMVFNPRQGTFSGGGKSGRIEGGRLQRIEVNLRNYDNAESARIRFYPNGTSDEFIVILLSDRNEQRAIVLDIMTGMPVVLNEEGLRNFERGKL